MLESCLEAHRVGQAAGKPTPSDVYLVKVTLTEVLGHFSSTINKGVPGVVGTNGGLAQNKEKDAVNFCRDGPSPSRQPT